MAKELPQKLRAKIGWKSPSFQIHWFDRKVNVARLIKDVALFASELYPEMKAETGELLGCRREFAAILHDPAYGRGNIDLHGMNLGDMALVLRSPSMKEIRVDNRGEGTNIIVKYYESTPDYGRVIDIGKGPRKSYSLFKSPFVAINFWPESEETNNGVELLTEQLAHAYLGRMS
jgi:hypothetical protein